LEVHNNENLDTEIHFLRSENDHQSLQSATYSVDELELPLGTIRIQLVEVPWCSSPWQLKTEKDGGEGLGAGPDKTEADLKEDIVTKKAELLTLATRTRRTTATRSSS
jgi:hypothetical protein